MPRENHPEEIECFRMPMPDGRFSPDKRYEYTYATRKSWEFIPALGRKDWRYFTNKGFTYVGKWVRSEQRRGVGPDAGDGCEWLEVFSDDRTAAGDGKNAKENVVSRDSDGLLCWRECPYNTEEYFVGTVTRKVNDEMIAEVDRVSPTIHHTSSKAKVAEKKCWWWRRWWLLLMLIIFLEIIVCFFLDRMGIAPLHSVWHVLSGTAVALTLYYVVVNGAVEK